MAAYAGGTIVLPDFAEGEVIGGVGGDTVPLPTIYIPQYGYRMRAYDQTLAREVYWTTVYIDSTGAEYTGPGPLVDIIVSHVIGT